MVREQFAFSPQPIDVTFDGWRGVLSYQDTAPGTEAAAGRFAKRASTRAADGLCAKAISLRHRAINMRRRNHLARRDLATALVDQRETIEAKNQLIDALRIQPFCLRAAPSGRTHPGEIVQALNWGSACLIEGTCL